MEERKASHGLWSCLINDGGISLLNKDAGWKTSLGGGNTDGWDEEEVREVAHSLLSLVEDKKKQREA